MANQSRRLVPGYDCCVCNPALRECEGLGTWGWVCELGGRVTGY